VLNSGEKHKERVYRITQKSNLQIATSGPIVYILTTQGVDRAFLARSAKPIQAFRAGSGNTHAIIAVAGNWACGDRLVLRSLGEKQDHSTPSFRHRVAGFGRVVRWRVSGQIRATPPRPACLKP